MADKPRAVILDLDAAVIDSRPAWRYALEEAVMMVTGERVDTGELVDEYRQRPWHHVVPIVVHDREAQDRCIELCEQYFRRSALKRLLVFDGIGMALDRIRGAYVEMGGVTRETHPSAMRQIESTGVDRFLSVLAPTNEGGWDAVARFTECVTYLEADPTKTVFVSPVEEDLASVSQTGALPIRAAWAEDTTVCENGLEHPSLLWASLERMTWERS